MKLASIFIILHNFYNINFEIILVTRFAKDKCLPLVRDMEAKGQFNKDLIKNLFENGVSSTFIFLV